MPRASALQIDFRVIPPSFKPAVLKALPANVLAFVTQHYNEHFVLCSDVIARCTRARPANVNAFLAVAQTLLDAVRGFDARHAGDPEALFVDITRRYTDAALFAKIDYGKPSGTCTQALIDAVQLDAVTFLPTVNCTRVLYDSVRQPRFKAHVLPLARLVELRDWTFARANFEPAFASADAVARDTFFTRDLRDARDTALNARLAEWVRARAAAAHANFVALARDIVRGDGRVARTHRHVGMQLLLRRVNIAHSEDHSRAAAFVNVCYRVEDVVFPLSANARRRGRDAGFTGTLYYQYTRSTSARGRPTWGAIGGRTFWKHYRALTRERGAAEHAPQRSFVILTSDASVTEAAQMDAYVALLGLAPADAALGPFYSRVVFGSVVSHNMGVLRALWSFMGTRGDDADADADAPRVPMSDVVAMRHDGLLALRQPAVQRMPNYRLAARVEKRRAASAGKHCPRRGLADVRGTVDDAGEAWFDAVPGSTVCRPRTKLVSPLWAPAVSWSDDDTLSRWLLSEWRRRSRAVLNKPYVRVKDNDNAAAAPYDALTSARHARTDVVATPALRELQGAVALVGKQRSGGEATRELEDVFGAWLDDAESG